MLVEFFLKQRRAASVVTTALVGAGLSQRSICVTANSWADQYGHHENFAVFVQSGGNDEPFYETGKTIVEAVKKVLAKLHGRINDNGANPVDQTAVAPF